MQSKRNGFTLIELLIVVAIVGLLAAIAIPNLLNALQKAKQKRTMADMRNIATAWEARATDAKRYNAAGGALSVLALCTEPITGQELMAMLTPTYIKPLPVTDGWSNPFRFRIDAAYPATAGGDANNYVIWSAGRNGTPNGAGGWDVTAASLGGGTTRFDDDIVFSNGMFVQYPEGLQLP